MFDDYEKLKNPEFLKDLTDHFMSRVINNNNNEVDFVKKRFNTFLMSFNYLKNKINQEEDFVYRNSGYENYRNSFIKDIRTSLLIIILYRIIIFKGSS